MEGNTADQGDRPGVMASDAHRLRSVQCKVSSPASCPNQQVWRRLIAREPDRWCLPPAARRAFPLPLGALWRAVDAEGEVLDVLVQSKRNKHAALKLMRKLLRKYAVAPERLVTDDLRSYRAAALDLGIDHLHDRGRWNNNRAENSHQPTRRRGRKMQCFKSAGSAQKFLSTHAAVYNTFNAQRHLTSAQSHRLDTAPSGASWPRRATRRAPLAYARPCRRPRRCVNALN